MTNYRKNRTLWLVSGIQIFLLVFMAYGGSYSVKENPESIELFTPYGPKTIKDPEQALGSSRKSYRVVVPIDSLKPPPVTPTPVPSNAAATPTPGTPAPAVPGAPATTSTVVNIVAPTAVRSPDSLDESLLAAKPTPTPTPSPFVESTGYYEAMADDFYRQGQYANSLRYLEQLTRDYPEYAKGWVKLGSVYHVLGLVEAAKTAWQKALNVEPTNPMAKEALEVYR